jgi:TPR repeat protein
MDASEKMFRRGNKQYNQGNYGEAKEWWRKAADAGHVVAMSNLGSLLGKQGKEDEAEPWLRKAAVAGDANAMYNLGVLAHHRGKDDEAEQWAHRAAAAGRQKRPPAEQQGWQRITGSGLGVQWRWGWRYRRSGGTASRYVNEMGGDEGHP